MLLSHQMEFDRSDDVFPFMNEFSGMRMSQCEQFDIKRLSEIIDKAAHEQTAYF